MDSPHATKTQPSPMLPYIDAAGDITAALTEINGIFETHGAVHIANTGVQGSDSLLPILPALGFGEKEQFSQGGRTSSAWQVKWVVPGLRRLDYYPPHLYLLPNGEINYQRHFPSRILFFCNIPPAQDGRTFLHAAKELERQLAQQQVGRTLMNKISRHGLTIEVGFLDANHPEKQRNYYQSWQERFGSDDRDTALAAAQSFTDEYDECWWQGDVLMTRITLPGFITSKRDGETYMRFPRIAADGPALHNGFRRFPLGNGEELTEQEKSLLRTAYSATREGYGWKQGDIILMDNIRYAHSREPFTGTREVFLSMAGTEYIGKAT